jgi:hypothetical protein
MTVLVLRCMERKFNAYLDERFDYANTAFVSNAGASVLGLKDTITQAIQHFGVEEIVILTHNGCGNSKEVAREIGSRDMRIGKEFYCTHVNPFRGRAFKDEADLDAMNPQVQLEEAKRLFPGVGRISSELIGLKMGVHTGRGNHSLIIANPSKCRFAAMADAVGEDVSDCYVAQGYGSDILADMLFAAKVLEIRQLYFLEQEGDEPLALKLRMEEARAALQGDAELKGMLADGEMMLDYVRLAGA